MEKRICKVCKVEKELARFSKYKTCTGKELRKGTCSRCYNNKYNPWIKKPMGKNTSDPRFKWDSASFEEKLNHIKLILDSHVIKSEGCWDWKGSLHHSGYAVTKFNKKQFGAHQASWMFYNNLVDFPENFNLWILHTCDNKKCTNPDHLYLGTPSNNAQDRENRNRGRVPFGDNHPCAILNETKVKEIRKMLENNATISSIARFFNCSAGAIEAIRNRTTWKHVT